MGKGPRLLMVNVATIISVLLAGALAFYSLFLLLVGVPGISVPENIPGALPPPPRLVYTPVPAALVPLVASLFILGGLLGGLRRRWLVLFSWVGVVVLLVFGVLAIFGIGLTLLISAVALLVLLTVVTISQRDPG